MTLCFSNVLFLDAGYASAASAVPISVARIKAKPDASADRHLLSIGKVGDRLQMMCVAAVAMRYEGGRTPSMPLRTGKESVGWRCSRTGDHGAENGRRDVQFVEYSWSVKLNPNALRRERASIALSAAPSLRVVGRE